jgi:hypothetical protein
VPTAREYTLGLYTLNLGDRVRKATNPFTGEPMEFYIDDGMTKAEVASVKRILEEMGATRADDSGYRYFSLPNGTRVGVGGFARDLASGIQSIPVEFVVRGEFSTPEASLVLSIVPAGNLFIGSSADPHLVATASQVSDQRFHQRHKHSSIATDANALASWVKQKIGSRDVLDTGSKTLKVVVDEFSKP